MSDLDEKAEGGGETAEQIDSLLKVGLERYGDGDISAAIVTWRQILALDPGNVQARDYIESADRREEGRAPPQSQEVASATDAVVGEARGLLEANEFEPALDLLMSASDAELGSLNLHAHLDLARSCLLGKYRAGVGDTSRLLTLDADPSVIAKFNLPREAGFLLSMVDDATTIEDLISLSGMDAFSALRNIAGLLEAGIVSTRS